MVYFMTYMYMITCIFLKNAEKTDAINVTFV